MADPGANDPPNHAAIGGHAARENDGERNPIGQAQRDNPVLAAVPARVVELDIRAGEALHANVKSKPRWVRFW
jgi:hypothetical protein